MRVIEAKTERRGKKKKEEEKRRKKTDARERVGEIPNTPGSKQAKERSRIIQVSPFHSSLTVNCNGKDLLG